MDVHTSNDKPGNQTKTAMNRVFAMNQRDLATAFAQMNSTLHDMSTQMQIVSDFATNGYEHVEYQRGEHR